MTLPVQPAPAVFLPESAPFTTEQRQWLNGFFAGLIAFDGSSTPVPAPPMTPQAEDGDAPWHDQTIPLPERMKLAEGRPLNRRMMAAMAQQDCGQCGYNCADYAGALFGGKERRLNLCAPGGKETARMLTRLYGELERAPSNIEVAQPLPAALSREQAENSAPTRDSPEDAVFVSRRRLNRTGSEKDTWHIEFDVAGTALSYQPGDSFGIFPRNEPHLVDAVIAAIGASPETAIGGRSLREALTDCVSLGTAPDALFQLISYLTGGEKRRKAKALGAGEDPDGDAANLDVLGALEKFGVHPGPEAFVEALDPLQPRLYSISSSPRINKTRLSLTVDAVRYRIANRGRSGVASTFLAERIAPGTKVKAYVQKAHSFALPSDPSTPIVMVGPGTGIAPFRAFLQERMATGAPGRNWLFFGHQRSRFDFFYEDELARMKAERVLTRLTLAWSRDGDEKIYVQHRMRDVGRDLWAWLAEGAHFYVCGDAKHMAKDVERALVDVIAAHGARKPDEAIGFLAELKKSGRYHQDVY